MDDPDVQNPAKFRFYEGGEEYMRAGEVAKHMGKMPSTLFSVYPSLYRRGATMPERVNLSSAGIFSRNGAPLATLVRASEIASIMQKDDVEESVKVPPSPVKNTVVESTTGDSYTLARSAHAQIIPQLPSIHTRVNGARNPMAAAFRHPDGCSTEADELQEVLVPIRLAIEHEGYKLRDQFTWNVHDATLQPELFAKLMCQDMELPLSFVPLIQSAIETQIADYSTFHDMASGSTAHRRTVVKLEVPIGSTQLVDQFEVDLSEPNNATLPEDLARVTVSDLGLGGEFVPVIAHSIREQMLLDHKAMLVEGTPSEAVPITAPADVFRTTGAEAWAPALYTLTDAELERREHHEDRESRRRRRAHRHLLDQEEEGVVGRRGTTRRSARAASKAVATVMAASSSRRLASSSNKADTPAPVKRTPTVRKRKSVGTPSAAVQQYLKRTSTTGMTPAPSTPFRTPLRPK
eukprot:m.114207 g.114207  ORF g.114207 m.114207 type:complete len:463 (-) comp16284_c0_seq2:40-1428(-)